MDTLEACMRGWQCSAALQRLSEDAAGSGSAHRCPVCPETPELPGGAKPSDRAVLVLQALEEVVWACLPKITRDIWQQTPHRMYSAEAEVNSLCSTLLPPASTLPTCLNPSPYSTLLPAATDSILCGGHGGFTLSATPSCHRQVKTELPLNKLVLPFTIGANSQPLLGDWAQSEAFYAHGLPHKRG